MVFKGVHILQSIIKPESILKEPAILDLCEPIRKQVVVYKSTGNVRQLSGCAAPNPGKLENPPSSYPTWPCPPRTRRRSRSGPVCSCCTTWIRLCRPGGLHRGSGIWLWETNWRTSLRFLCAISAPSLRGESGGTEEAQTCFTNRLSLAWDGKTEEKSPNFCLTTSSRCAGASTKTVPLETHHEGSALE